MNSNTTTPRTSKSLRRAVPALAIVVLAIGLGACQTPPKGAIQEPAARSVQVPAGIDTRLPADRIAEQLDRQALDAERFSGMPADRIADQLARESGQTGAEAQVHTVAGGNYYF
jgi:hypothetical protein